MTYTHNPIGMVVLSSLNPDADIERWKRTKPHAMTFTQNTFGLVKRCLDAIPELQVAILRTVLSGEGEKNLHTTGARGAENMVNAFIELCEYEGLDRDRCYLQLWNEPDLTTDRDAKLYWTIYVLRLARERGVRCSALGIGMATLTHDDWVSGDFDLLLQEFTDGYHLLNIHSYGGPVLWAGAAGKLPDTYLNKDLAQQIDAPSPYDVQIGSRAGNWYIGRVFDILTQCDILGIAHPRIIVGECGIDRPQDLESATLSNQQIVNIYDILEKRYTREVEVDGKLIMLKVPWPHWGMRGWHTCQWVHEDYYPDWTPAKTYVEMLKWQVWMYDHRFPGEKPHVEAIQVFAHCPGMEDWAIAHGFDISDSDEWYRLVTAYGDAILNPSSIDPEPLPDTPEAEPWMLRLMLVTVGVLIGVIVYSLVIAPHVVAMYVEINTMEELLNQLFAIPALATITYTSGIVYFLTEVWKRARQRWFNDVKWLRWAEPEVVAPLLVFAFLGLHGIAVEYAYDNALKTIAQFITELIGAIGPYVLGMIGTNVLVSYSYDKLQAADVPGFTYKIRKSVKKE
jgi:hypothetical protein